MRQRSAHFTIFLLLIVSALLGFRAGQADTTTTKFYSGVEVQALVDVVSNHGTQIERLSDDLGVVCGMLNSDSGVDYINFAPTNSGSNTFLTIDRR